MTFSLWQLAHNVYMDNLKAARRELVGFEGSVDVSGHFGRLATMTRLSPLSNCSLHPLPNKPLRGRFDGGHGALVSESVYGGKYGGLERGRHYWARMAQ